MRHNRAAAGHRLRCDDRFRCVPLLAVVAAFLTAFLAIPGSTAVGASGAFSAGRCFLDAAPAEGIPPANAPTPAAVDENETSVDEDHDSEDDSEYSWPVTGQAKTPSAHHEVRASRADRADTPRFFVDAADLSRFCKLTI